MKKKKIYIQERRIHSYNAGSKARNDCDTILESYGYKLLTLTPLKFSLWYKILRKLNIFKVAFNLYSANTCFIQYPLYSYLNTPFFWHFTLKFFSGKLEVLIHDIDGLQYGNHIEPNLLFLLRKCDKIIVHTPRMKEIIEKSANLDINRIHVLYLFDYLTNESTQPADISGNKIIFAGNLEKSAFLSKIDLLPSSISFNLYGVYNKTIKEGTNCTYKGKFSPENISAMEGNWGLVWDGDQLETCHGTFGEYLKINSSHKISLYIAACKPVILWKESSISNFIVSNNLGIAVNSLYEIPERLATLTPTERLNIEYSVNNFSKRIKNGEMLKTFIQNT